MAKRDLQTWAKIRYDRETNGFSFTELAQKYGISRSAINARAKKDGWGDPQLTRKEIEQRKNLIETTLKKTSKVVKKHIDNNKQDDASKKQDDTSEKQDDKQERKNPRRGRERLNNQNDTSEKQDDTSKKQDDKSEKQDDTSKKQDDKKNGTENGTDGSKFNDAFQQHIDNLIKGIHPLRAREKGEKQDDNSEKQDDKNDSDPRRIVSIDKTKSFSASDFRITTDLLHELSVAYRDLKSLHEGKYHPNYARIAHSMALLGATPEMLAESLGVTERTIYNWLEKHRDFYVAWQGGKYHADSRVAESLYSRAVGYNAEISDYKVVDGVLIEMTKTIHVPPDPRAQEYWLNNRRPEFWKSQVEYTPPPPPPLLDDEEDEKLYQEVLHEADENYEKMQGRGERMNLVLDGDSED